jgi:hypothetical protein
VEGLIEMDITAPEDSPMVYEFELFLEMPVTLDFCVVATDVVDRRRGAAFRSALTSRDGYIFTHSSETELLSPNAPQMFDGAGNGIFSTVLLDSIEWEGPLTTGIESSRRQDVIPPADATPEVVAEHLHRFAGRAWRRPVQQDELTNYLQSYQAERDAGENTADAYRVALLGVLTSRHFIYLVEGDPEIRDKLTDFELASRLSYFLWSSMPDEELFRLASDQKLHQPAVLRQQVERLLKDEKAAAFTHEFTGQWLSLRAIDATMPDRTLYPEYDDSLKSAMLKETNLFFNEVLTQDLPLTSFVASDFTFLNERLAKHYGIPGVEGMEMRRVSLPAGSHSGGVMTMGSVLKVTANGTTTSPILRGAWVL